MDFGRLIRDTFMWAGILVAGAGCFLLAGAEPSPAIYTRDGLALFIWSTVLYGVLMAIIWQFFTRIVIDGYYIIRRDGWW